MSPYAIGERLQLWRFGRGTTFAGYVVIIFCG